MSKYLRLAEIPSIKKTKQFMVESKQHGYCLGIIKWYAPWRQYCFYPGFETVFNNTCLLDIVEFLNKLKEGE